MNLRLHHDSLLMLILPVWPWATLPTFRGHILPSSSGLNRLGWENVCVYTVYIDFWSH
jgi:hypothetical protein